MFQAVEHLIEVIAQEIEEPQVKRLQDAGINPALALSQISSGSATSSAGGQTPPR